MHETQAFKGAARKRKCASRPDRSTRFWTSIRVLSWRRIARRAKRQDWARRVERKRVEAVVETLANLRSRGESLAEVAHDASNMVTALGLYCDLLEEPGVLATPFLHYGTSCGWWPRPAAGWWRSWWRSIQKAPWATGAPRRTNQAAGQSRRRLARRPRNRDPAAGAGTDRCRIPAGPTSAENANRRWDLMPAEPIANLAAELLANRNLLAALAGPSIALTMDAEGGAQPVRLTGEDLTRVLVNLVKNAAEAMPSGGRIHIGLHEQPAASGERRLPGAHHRGQRAGHPRGKALEKIFESGYTSALTSSANRLAGLSHRGLGLAITRSIVEGAGGRIHAANRAQGGARFEIELPVRKTAEAWLTAGTNRGGRLKE
jgi:signal transduction histidine kinase